MKAALDAPLYEAMQAFAQRKRHPFHMPGNRGGKSFADALSQGFARFEATELPGLDDLNRPKAAAAAAEAKAAAFYGAAQTLFFTSGTTTAIFTMLAAALEGQDLLWISPLVHLSVFHASACMDLRLQFLPMKQEACKGSFFPSHDLEAIEVLLKRGPLPKAVLLVSPDYYGQSHLQPELIQRFHDAGVLVLVDEAHGAHLPALPPGHLPSVGQVGADLWVQSMHKTLPCLAPASLLHLSKERLAKDPSLMDRLLRFRPVFQSSSPSYPVAASMDWARARLAAAGQEAFKPLLRRLAAFKQELPSAYDVPEPSMERDPCRLVISFERTGLERSQIEAALQAEGVDVEMIDLKRLVLLPAIDSPEADFLALQQALSSALEAPKRANKEKIAALEKGWRAILTRKREGPFAARPLLFTPSKQSVRLIAPYPPGVPLFYPGEAITEEEQDVLHGLAGAGISMGSILSIKR